MEHDNQFKIALKLYQCRETAKSFFKDEYSKKLEPFINNIKMVMIKENLDEISALLIIGKMPHYQGDGMIQLLYMAAVTELIEPSNQIKL